MSLCVFKNGRQCCSKREREKSLTTELFWMSRANVVETSQYMLQSCRMGSSTSMPTWALTTWPTFLDRLHNIVTVEDQMDAEQMRYIVIWDNIFAVVQNWFHKCPQFSLQYLPPYIPFFLAWRWMVYDLQPYVRISLIQAMEEACDLLDSGSVQGWIRHLRIFFPHGLARENVDEVL